MNQPPSRFAHMDEAALQTVDVHDLSDNEAVDLTQELIRRGMFIEYARHHPWFLPESLRDPSILPARYVPGSLFLVAKTSVSAMFGSLD